MRRGDVWNVDLPLSSGKEQGGQRPAIVLQDEVYGQGSPLVLVALLTSQLAALRFPAAVRVEPSTENGLSVTSVAMVFQTRALDRRRFRSRLGNIEPALLDRVVAELRRLTGDEDWKEETEEPSQQGDSAQQAPPPSLEQEPRATPGDS
jgi:mRNA interferase MazF